MKLLLNGLLLASLCALSSWSVSSVTVVVTQPGVVSVMEGETVNITCCWTGEFDRGRVNWLKNQTEIKNEIINMPNQSEGLLTKKTNSCSTLTFVKIKREDSGPYICRVLVEVPRLTVAEGNGTNITVQSKESTTDRHNNSSASPTSASHLPLPVIVSVALLVPLFFITLICFCCLRRKQAQAARVIYEVPHTDSEMSEMDKHSTSSSRGSSQWCQVLVYESVDYFERVETKQSG